jgi:hypothetical protein
LAAYTYEYMFKDGGSRFNDLISMYKENPNNKRK